MSIETASPTGFRLPRPLLPRPGIDLRKWAVIACDQYTSEPDYWRRVADEVGDAPSTLHLIFPEVYLDRPDAPARIEQIKRTMRRYLEQGLLVEHAGAICVERRLGTRVRRGLMLELDLECYDFSAGSTSLIRPTEGTMVERLAPRIAVRSDAALEVPHILVLIDDAEGTVIEPLAAARLATAKSVWERIKATVGMDHPARWALVEVENIHDPALGFEPIHRLLFGVSADVRAALQGEFGERVAFTDLPSAPAMRERLRELPPGRQAAGLVGPGERFAVAEFADPPSSLAVGTLQPFVDRFVRQGGASHVDYVHGDETLARLAQQPGCVGLHIGTVGKRELLRRVVREGPLPRKTFSMGEADEKRFYVEARRIR
jgi:hypothetical protein